RLLLLGHYQFSISHPRLVEIWHHIRIDLALLVEAASAQVRTVKKGTDLTALTSSNCRLPASTAAGGVRRSQGEAVVRRWPIGGSSRTPSRSPMIRRPGALQ